MRFEWDYHNLKHVIDDHPERENTVDEVESIFRDPHLIMSVGRRDTGEQRFEAVGRGNSQIVKVVIFSFNDLKIKPISCWSANKQTTRYYYENIRGK